MSTARRKSGTSGPSIPRGLRTRPAVEVTLPRDLITRLDALCTEHGASRSRAVEGAIVLGLRSGDLAQVLAERVAARAD